MKSLKFTHLNNVTYTFKHISYASKTVCPFRFAICMGASIMSFSVVIHIYMRVLYFTAFVNYYCHKATSIS